MHNRPGGSRVQTRSVGSIQEPRGGSRGKKGAGAGHRRPKRHVGREGRSGRKKSKGKGAANEKGPRRHTNKHAATRVGEAREGKRAGSTHPPAVPPVSIHPCA